MIAIERLTKKYGTTLAVDDVSFAAEAGRVTGFLGPNGAGRSTTQPVQDTYGSGPRSIAVNQPHCESEPR
jgi:ABC-type Na+ transport system ATPase subunit NatA